MRWNLECAREARLALILQKAVIDPLQVKAPDDERNEEQRERGEDHAGAHRRERDCGHAVARGGD